MQQLIPPRSAAAGTVPQQAAELICQQGMYQGDVRIPAVHQIIDIELPAAEAAHVRCHTKQLVLQVAAVPVSSPAVACLIFKSWLQGPDPALPQQLCKGPSTDAQLW